MLSKYWKNTVLTGPLDHYCLACESHLKGFDEVEAHIDKPVHKKKLESTPYFEKYKDDKIRQVPSGYYCEACNILYATTTKVNFHVGELSHISNLGFYHLKRSGNSVIAYDNICINEKAWNGFIDDTCIICDMDFPNENIHKNEKKHILNLVQSKIDFGDEKSIFREIDHATVQCLTCNVVVSTTSTHFGSIEHENKYESSRVFNSASIPAKAEPKSDNKKTKNKKPNIKEEDKPVKPTESNNVETNNNYTEDSDDEYLRNTLGAKNYVMRTDDKYICILCDQYHATSESVDNHVKSSHHLMLLKLYKNRLQNKKAGKSNADTNEVEIQDDDHDEKDEAMDKISEAASDLAKDRIEVNLERRMVSCKKCSKTIEFDYDVIKSHVEEHKKKDDKASKFDLKERNEFKSKTLYTKPVTMKQKEQESSVVVSEEMVNFAKKHDLVHKNNKYSCAVCSLSLAPTLKILKDHVVSTAHKNRLARKSDVIARSFAQKIPSKDFIKIFSSVESLHFKDIIVNDKLCVNILSFYMFTKQDYRLRCEVCGVSFNFEQADQHRVNYRHEEYMQTTLVVSSLTDEFVREVRDGGLHCGFCNLVIDSDDMDDHLDSISHKECKRSAQSRLERYLPELMNGRQQKAAEIQFLRMLANLNQVSFE